MSKDVIRQSFISFSLGGLGGIIVVLLGTFWGEIAVLGFIAVLLWNAFVIHLLTKWSKRGIG